MFINYFLTMIDIITSQNSDLTSCTTLYSDCVMGGKVFDIIIIIIFINCNWVITRWQWLFTFTQI
jgi:hypothetical protein